MTIRELKKEIQDLPDEMEIQFALPLVVAVTAELQLPDVIHARRQGVHAEAERGATV